MHLKHTLINLWLLATLVKGEYLTFLKSAHFHGEYCSARHNCVATQSQHYVPSPGETCESNAMWQ